jgi:hypothetical protein
MYLEDSWNQLFFTLSRCLPHSDSDERIKRYYADFRIVGLGIFFDGNKFKKRSYFGPYAFRIRDSLNVEVQKRYHVVDFTVFRDGYINEEWFQTIISRWATNAEKSELEEFYMKPFIRGYYAGKILVHYETGYPQYYLGSTFDTWSLKI